VIRKYYFSALSLILIFLALDGTAYSQSGDQNFSTSVTRAQFSVGVQGDAWNSNLSQPDHGWEVWTPLSVALEPLDFLKIYGQSEYGQGQYTDSLAGTETMTLSGFSDTVAGVEGDFKIFELPSVLRVDFNLPSGNPNWETKQSASIIPTEFIDSNYRGRGFGLSAFYGLSLPSNGAEYGFAVGYLYSGSFNPFYGQGVPSDTLLGDSLFLALNRFVDEGEGKSDVLRVSAFYFLPSWEYSQEQFQMGPNINASYAWSNPKALSMELGGQYFFSPMSIQNQGSSTSFGSFGPRFNVAFSYAFGNLNLAGRAKYILPNGESQDSVLFDGGGLLYGFEPSLRVPLDTQSSLKFTLALDTVDAFGAGLDSAGSRVDVQYLYGVLGTTYEVHL
jgi:hypothetical protein